MQRYAWIFALLKTTAKAAVADRGNFFLMSIFMTLNNIIWFSTWWLLFRVAGTVGGWNLTDMARLYGITAFAFGMAFIVCGGAWRMAHLITEGQLDIHLGRPRPVLLSLVFSRIEPEGLGDAISGIILLLALGHLHFWSYLAALGLGSLAAAIIVAAAIAIQSLVFWIGGKTGIVDQLFECFICFATMPQQGLPLPIKFILFTALPAGFVAFLPADLLRDFSVSHLLVMIGAAIVFPVLASWFFYQGLRKYTSGNRMMEMR